MIHVVIGTKAQLVKMGPVMAELESRGAAWNFVFTGQHHETIRDLRENFGVRDPDVVLHEGRDIKSVPAMAVWMARILARALLRRPDPFRGDRRGIVLVHGDTFSCLLGALLARVRGLRVGHVESGLRSFDLFNPFPEELTRVLTFRLTDVYFCPGAWAVENLRGHRGRKIDTVHNTLLDSLRLAAARMESVDVPVPRGRYCVVSLHRFENIFDRAAMERVVGLVERIAERMPALFILHPPTRAKLKRFGMMERLKGNPRIRLRPRYDYFRFIKLVWNSEFLATDGGSNQEECFYMGKPCLLLRKATERQEGIGRNVVLSRYEESAVDGFLENYRDLAFGFADFGESPTRTIVDEVVGRFGG